MGWYLEVIAICKLCSAERGGGKPCQAIYTLYAEASFLDF
jgi:hypothetical protein